jgi:branched-chain amino acid transport system permease protein
MAALATALFLGIVVGSIYSLSAFGLVLTYRASGVFNFAHGAVGMISAFAFYQLVQGGPVNLVVFTYGQRWKLPSPVAFVVVVAVLAPIFGWLADRFMFRSLRDAGEVVKIVATIGLLVALQGVAGVVWGAATTLSPTSVFSRNVYVFGGFRATGEQIAAVVLTGSACCCLCSCATRPPASVCEPSSIARTWRSSPASIRDASRPARGPSAWGSPRSAGS